MFGFLPKRRIRVPKPVKPSRAEELAYSQAVLRILARDDAEIRAELDRAIPVLASVLRTDALGDDLAAIFTRLRTVVAVGEAAARNVATEMLERVQRKNAVGHAETLPQTGPHLGGEAWLRDQQSLALAENVRLIQGVRGQRLEDVLGILARGLQAGTPVDQLAKEIRARLHISRTRATGIAIDQTLKWHADLTRLRQQDAGIDEYDWITVGDEKVRHGHARLHKTRQRWSEPPIDNPKTGSRHHPGKAIRCRCVPRPVLPGFEDDDTNEGGT
jgi:SPP1 gp7 family putative phage head morphogenesis protein